MTDSSTRVLVWFRGKDLRLRDHEPLRRAARIGTPIPLFVLDPHFFAPERARELPHRMQFLLESLRELRAGLRALGSDLWLVSGRAVDRVPELAQRLGVHRVLAQAWNEPFGRRRDAIVAQRLARFGAALELHEGELLHPPGSARTASGGVFRVFTPFARAQLRLGPPAAELAPPSALPAWDPSLRALADAELPTLESLGIAHNPQLLRGGERAAQQRLRTFLQDGQHYAQRRDQMAEAGSSRLSQDLKFGTLSVRTVWHAAQDALHGDALERFQLELLWRSFFYETLSARPELLQAPFRPEFAGFPWREDHAAFRAWQHGETGYPVVDAAARQLLAEGYVHNRARMIAASFLCKHLMLPYAWGEAHYLRFLTDGDWAINNGNWQWSAGCGVDAQPYFRVFNPVSQGQKFDADGEYVRRWLPELGRLDTRVVHAPWTASDAQLAHAGLRLGRDYPRPIVDHAKARARFLEAARVHLAQTDATPS